MVLQFTGTPVLNDPKIAGGLVYALTWADLNPAQGSYAFDKLTAAVAPWLDAGKHVALRAAQNVLGNGIQGTPQWVFDLGVPVLDASLHVPDYFNSVYKSSRDDFDRALAAWLKVQNWRPLWLEYPFGDYGETKPDSEQGHTIPIAAFEAAGYTNATWQAWILDRAQTALSIYSGLDVPLVANMDRSFVFSDSGFNAEELGGHLRALGFWLGDHGYRENVVPSQMYLNGPSIYEQYLSTSSTGNDPNVEVVQMATYAKNHGGYTLLYGSDIPKAQSGLTQVIAL